MSRLAYVDAIGGVAGDMLLGALLGAGASEARVRAGLRALGLGVELELATARRHGIAARRVMVVAPEDPPVHRTWATVRELVDRASLPARARDRAQSVFRALAEAEGRVHDISPEDVHFHEVGALDAIADVCGIAVALEDLDIDALVCSPLPCPRGLIDASHGRLPLPAPATLELLRTAPLYGVPLEVELVTPTGAAVIAALAEGFGALPALRLESIGYGAGARELEELPNLVRVLVGERTESPTHTDVALIEANLDDLQPELMPDALEACFAAGALDVWITPAQMKKGRPGLVLAALARPSDEQAVAEAILRETTTLGVRRSSLRRWELERVWQTVEVSGEPVRVKLGSLHGRVINAMPEHDDCAAVARLIGQPVKVVWAAALSAATNELASTAPPAAALSEPPEVGL